MCPASCLRTVYMSCLTRSAVPGCCTPIGSSGYGISCIGTCRGRTSYTSDRPEQDWLKQGNTTAATFCCILSTISPPPFSARLGTHGTHVLLSSTVPAEIRPCISFSCRSCIYLEVCIDSICFQSICSPRNFRSSNVGPSGAPRMNGSRSNLSLIHI